MNIADDADRLQTLLYSAYDSVLVGRCFGDMGRYVERLFEKLFV